MQHRALLRFSLLPALGAGLYVFLLLLDAVRFFPYERSNLGMSAIRFGYSALVAGLFLGVGSLVWWYARERKVAALLFCFCCAMMATFTVQTGALLGSNDPILSTIGASASALALAPFSILLLFFPRNYLTALTFHRRLNYRTILLQSYIVLITALACFSVLDALARHFFPESVPPWWTILYFLYYLIALVAILITLLLSYRAASVREHQQLRLFVVGVSVAFAPGLLISVLPRVFQLLPSAYTADGQWSTLTVFVLPLSLGYSILRYQLLVDDASVRRAMSRCMGMLGLGVLLYLLITVNSLVMQRQPLISPFLFLLLGIGLAPAIWQGMRAVTERFFFSEMRHYRTLIEPTQRVRIPLDLEEVVRLVSIVLEHAFETTSICLLILNSEGRYCPIPAKTTDALQSAFRRRAIEELLPQSSTDVTGVDAHHESIFRLAEASRPLYMSELHQMPAINASQKIRLFMGDIPHDSHDLLVSPVWAKGEVIGLLILGERGDRQRYAGPDFEAISFILSQYAPDLDNARLALNLHQAYARQQELDRLKDLFIVTASHELRTPLTAVMGYIELLSDFDDQLPPEDRAGFLATARRGCEELETMVANIMDVGRVEVDAKQMHLCPIRLAEAIEQNLEIFQAQMRREHRAIHLSVLKDIWVLADDLRLRQVFLNLVGNALKYSPGGSPIDIVVEQLGELILVRIHDQGHGIPPDEQLHLFERFYRLERDMNSPVRGVGLGLYICKQIVEAMGGSIWVESSGVEGEGSMFAFSLKVAAAEMLPAAARNTVAEERKEDHASV